MIQKRDSGKNPSAVARWKRSTNKTRRTRPVKPTDSKAIAALYWDINAACHFRAIVAGLPSSADKKIYDQICEGTQAFIDKTLYEYMNKPTDTSQTIKFIKRLGWKLFAICAHAESFRHMCTKTSTKWLTFQRRIQEAQRSLEVFARSRKLEWRGPLLKHAQRELPGLRDALSPDIDIAREHPHHLVQTRDGYLRRPRHNGKAQVHINRNIFDASRTADGQNPLRRLKEWGRCHQCGSEGACACRIDATAGDMVELVEFENRGVGVRALTKFKRGEILGEYTGVAELHYRGSDSKYLMRQGVLYTDENGRRRSERVAEIDSIQFGGWTRYINHSCDPSLAFAYTVVGEEAATIVKTVRDISTFEELTVDYGDGYWSRRGLRCLCGSRKCRFR